MFVFGLPEGLRKGILSPPRPWMPRQWISMGKCPSTHWIWGYSSNHPFWYEFPADFNMKGEVPLTFNMGISIHMETSRYSKQLGEVCFLGLAARARGPVLRWAKPCSDEGLGDVDQGGKGQGQVGPPRGHPGASRGPSGRFVVTINTSELCKNFIWNSYFI